MEETNAFSPLNQFIMQQNAISPTKTQIDEKLMELVRSFQNQTAQNIPTGLTENMPQLPVMIPRNEPQGDQMLKASPSASSELSSPGSGEIAEHMLLMQQHQQQMQKQQGFQPLQQLSIDSSEANIAAGALASAEQRSNGHCESWAECFTTTRLVEYEALLFSVYVTERSDRKYDGWTYFDCLHRLQSKCRYRVRAKKQDEFYIVEEKCVHNHGAVEPVGQAGSHAGLPKTIREIVDRSYNENWLLEDRTIKVDEEIKRLGLPENPRLGRQIDNRVAYLRRVKNLHETRRIQDQVNGSGIQDTDQLTEALYNPAVMQALMDRNGGKLTVGQGVVEQLFGPQTIADLVSSGPSTQGSVSEEGEMTPSPPSTEMNGLDQLAKPMAINPTPEFFQFLQQQQQNLNEQTVGAAVRENIKMINKNIANLQNIQNTQGTHLNINGGMENIQN
ncbi:hypothetical protein CRE_02029 [Caenorhabditis remanei]|uniref:FLYWCH-type domain-containing protein n=1 Tax=Caenorhabditis remanei TaxID=31234 RepID=E3LGW9_CAERE|nr:hypothetical protein CRE_02029 [Caenorhabditis remanei]